MFFESLDNCKRVAKVVGGGRKREWGTEEGVGEGRGGGGGGRGS